MNFFTGRRFILQPYLLMNLLRITHASQPLPPRLQKIISRPKMSNNKCKPFEVNQDELKNRLTPLQYHVTQEKGTETPFAGEFVNLKDDGSFQCIVCGQTLFSSDKKFDSGSGWPSFYDVIDAGNVKVTEDHSHGMERLEVTCSRCDAHLGHVFDDGPKPSGLRYCINSASLCFKKKAEGS